MPPISNTELNNQISKLYTKVELTEQKVSSLNDTMNQHIVDAKELAKEVRAMTAQVQDLINTVENSHLQSIESKNSIAKLEQLVENQGLVIRSWQSIINSVKWLLGFVGSTGLVAFLTWLVSNKK
jgi:uncharacterized coiled-coil DUF342 family protein